MWYAIVKLHPVHSTYKPQYAFVRSLRRGVLPVKRSNLKRTKVLREVKIAWHVMRLHSHRCREFIEPYENRWMTDEEFKKAVEDIVNNCYRSKETRSRKLKMFEEWLRSPPKLGEVMVTPEDEYVIRLDKSEIRELVGNSCVQAYVLPTDSPVTARILNKRMYHIYRGKNNRIAITEVAGDNVYAVFISAKCLESGAFEIPHLPRYGARVLWWYIDYDYLSLVEKVDMRLVEFINTFTDDRTKVEIDKVGKEIVERVASLFKEYENLVAECRHRRVKPLLVPAPVENAVEDFVYDARDGKVWTNNIDDLRRKLEKYSQLLEKAIEVMRERIALAMLVS
jgi:hypothetical protein